uniref:Uncharacterized protein n=1 Tax=Panagrolaimus sp. ES5 TaxID=591445 RepID=A0AC34EZI2_9BILA
MASFFKKSEKKPTFGQEYKSAVGYDDNWATICYEKKVNLTCNVVEEKCSYSLKVIENATDYRNICEVLHISSSEMVGLNMYTAV